MLPQGQPVMLTESTPGAGLSWHLDAVEAEILRHPFGTVARDIEDLLTFTDPAGADEGLSPMDRARLRAVLTQARAALEQRDRDQVAADLTSMVKRSGLGAMQFAARCGVLPSRLSAYLSGHAEPAAAFMLRARAVAQDAVHDAA